MKKTLATALICLFVVACLGQVLADETPPPVKIGSGQSVTQISNGQTVIVSASGVQATVYFNEVSSSRVTGTAVRTSGGTSSGNVTVRWQNRNRIVTLVLSAQCPDQPFGMEGGDGDKRVPEYVPGQ